MRDKGKCRSCGLRSTLQVHHIVFRSHGGPDETWNLVTLCESCHSGIHTAVREGEHGLVIMVPCNANEKVQFKRSAWWKPGT